MTGQIKVDYLALQLRCSKVAMLTHPCNLHPSNTIYMVKLGFTELKIVSFPILLETEISLLSLALIQKEQLSVPGK